MTHTLYEARMLECRQTSATTWSGVSSENAIFVFPTCSADKCGHWFMERTHTPREFFSQNELSDGEYDYAIACLHNEGWESQDGLRMGRSKYEWMHRPLSDMERLGRCGLIAETYVEVSTN